MNVMVMEDKYRMGFYDDCARRIQTHWRSFRDRRVFRLLMNTVRSAEQCLTSAVVHQLSPKEAELLKDPSLSCKLRFRFAGPWFPPLLVFKIFHTGGRRNYLSGKNLFTSSNQGTADACRMMGNRVFLDLISEDETHTSGVERQDVICVRDYMQFSSHMDELPACFGGRENGWRFLSLKVLSRDVPRREGVKLRMGGSDAGRPIRAHSAGQQLSHREFLTSTRRSKHAQNFVARRRHIYSLAEAGRVLDEHEDKNHEMKKPNEPEKLDIKIVLPAVETEDWEDSESEWEEEAERLCNWSKQLNVDAVETLEPF